MERKLGNESGNLTRRVKDAKRTDVKMKIRRDLRISGKSKK
jgi:hypothetical protein